MRNKTFVWIMPLFALFLFSTCKKDDDNESNLVKDYDGNEYNTVTIGTQTWMKENLKTTHYNDGMAIPNVTDAETWAGLTTGAYCYYDNSTANAATYGSLYNWHAVNIAKLCPSGWHVPTDNEFKNLEIYLGMTQAKADSTGWRGTDQGSQLKSISGWKNNGNGTNSSGFSALPGGYRGYYGSFFSIGFHGRWWSATEYGTSDAYKRFLNYDYTRVYRYGNSKGDGFSVRCVRDN